VSGVERRGPERQLAKLDELGARANVGSDRIEALNRRVAVAGRPMAALLLFSGAAMAAARLL
jgi:hypothetical protein